MHQTTRFSVLAVMLSAVLAQSTRSEDTQAKGPLKDDKAVRQSSAFKAGRLDDENDALTRTEQRDLRWLVSGSEEAPVGAKRRALMEKTCRWYIYRLTSPAVHLGQDGTVSEIMEEILGGTAEMPRSRIMPSISRRADPDAEDIARRKRQWAYAEELCPIIIAHVRKVMELDALIARLNALRILHALAELSYDGEGNEEVVTEFINAIENPHEHDAVRLWAFYGIHALISLQTSDDSSERVDVQNPQRMDHALSVTLAWLEARMRMDANVVADMREEERDGISYVRRAAIRLLGSAGRPFLKEQMSLREGPVALALVKLISIDEGSLASPPPTWREAVEAAHALCHLKPNLSPSYQPEFVAFQLARFVAALGAAGGDDPTREMERWKFFGFHLREGLESLVQITPAERGGAYVKRAAGGMNDVVEHLMDITKNRQAAQELFEWTKRNPPTAKAVFEPHGQ